MPCTIHEKQTTYAIMSVDWSWCKCMDQEVESLMIKKGRSFTTRSKLNIHANEFVPGSVQELGHERGPVRWQDEKLYEGHGWGSMAVNQETGGVTVIYSTSDTAPSTPTFMSNDPSNGTIFATEEALRMYRIENEAQVDLEALNLGSLTYHEALVEYTPTLVEETARLVYTHIVRDLRQIERNLVKDDRAAARYVQRVVQERLVEMKQRERDIDTRLNTVVTISEIGLLQEEAYGILVEHLKAQVEIVQGMTSVLKRLQEILQMQNVYIWDLLAQLRELAVEI